MVVILSTRLAVILKFPYLCCYGVSITKEFNWQAGEVQCFDCKKSVHAYCNFKHQNNKPPIWQKVTVLFFNSNISSLGFVYIFCAPYIFSSYLFLFLFGWIAGGWEAYSHNYRHYVSLCPVIHLPSELPWVEWGSNGDRLCSNWSFLDQKINT